MSAHPTQQLHQELHNELSSCNQLLRLISVEMKQIKELIRPGGELEFHVKENASLMQKLAAFQQIDLGITRPPPRKAMEMLQATDVNDTT